jgi:3-phosphoshikimate 1-carboxyvinyltransferase
MTDWSSQLPESLAIKPLGRPPHARVRVPGSKSISNRALILAALSHPAKGSELRGLLRSEDTEVMIDALRALDIRVRTAWPQQLVHVRRGMFGRIIPAETADLFVANSGTSMRFLTALVSLGQGRYRIDGVSRMRERPIEDLLAALRPLGVRASSEQQKGYPPVVIEANGLSGGRVRIKGDVSSQFLSALLMAAPLAREEITIEVDGPIVSAPYVAMTVAMMRQFQVDVDTDGKSYFRVPTRPWYESRSWNIEPDASAASYFFGAAAITRGEITVAGLGSSSLQGDLRFVDVLEAMGCRVVRHSDEYTVIGGPLRGIEVDMNATSDCIMTLAAVACFAKGPTTIRNVAHVRHKETDRLRALATELRKIGPKVEEFADGLTIIPGALHGAAIDTYNDHRMAMGMALVGLTIPGVIIRNPACVAKTYPRFFEDLEQLR